MPPGRAESVFLARAINHMFQDLCGEHPRKVLHTIQAQILISLYMLTSARPVEGIYHSSVSVSLAIRFVVVNPFPPHCSGTNLCPFQL